MKTSVRLGVAILLVGTGILYLRAGFDATDLPPTEPAEAPLPAGSKMDVPAEAQLVPRSPSDDGSSGEASPSRVESSASPPARVLALLSNAERLAHEDDIRAYRDALSKLESVIAAILANSGTRERLLSLFEDPLGFPGHSGDVWKRLLSGAKEEEIRPRVLRRLDAMLTGGSRHPVAPRTAADGAAIVELLVDLAPLEERAERILEYLDRFERSPYSAVMYNLLRTVQGEGNDLLVDRLKSLLDGGMWDGSFEALCRLTNEKAHSAAFDAFMGETDPLKQQKMAGRLAPLLDPGAAKVVRDRFLGMGRPEVYLGALYGAPESTVVTELPFLISAVKQLLAEPEEYRRFSAALSFTAQWGKQLARAS